MYIYIYIYIYEIRHTSYDVYAHLGQTEGSKRRIRLLARRHAGTRGETRESGRGRRRQEEAEEAPAGAGGVEGRSRGSGLVAGGSGAFTAQARASWGGGRCALVVRSTPHTWICYLHWC